MTIKKLKELLNDYPENMEITNEQNENFIHITNLKNSVILSTKKPIGICNRTNANVYPSIVKGYAGFCPELDEDLYSFEFELIVK
jgi:hypothetical protein